MALALTCHALDGPAADDAAITFNEHVAPIIHASCSSCHRSGTLAPFALLTYEDVKSRAALVADATRSRRMPPWLPRSEPGEFVGQRGLTRAQIDLIGRWAAAGAPRGDPGRSPAPPEFVEDWQLGPPDRVVRMPAPYALKGSGPDVFRNVVIPVPLERTRYVKGIELLPGNPRVLHHATITVDRSDVSRRLDAQDSEVGFGMMGGDSKPPDGHFLGWTPGKTPRFLPEGMGWRLDPGSDLVIQMHLLPSGRPESIRATVGLYFTDTPPVQIPVMLRLGSQIIDIPAGEARYLIRDSFTLPVDVTVLRIYPHAHYLATTLRGTAELPDGTTRRLIHIPHWHFHWQDDYRYTTPMALPAGTRLTMEYGYDNSEGNPHNPSAPPKRVVYGPRSSDEMGDLWIQVLPEDAGDLSALKRAFARKEVPALIAGYEQRLGIDPDDWNGRSAVAALYLALGDIGSARRHLREALRLNPRFDRAHNNLAALYERENRYSDAIRHYELAVTYNPENYKAHTNLANAYARANRLDDASRHYQQALAVNPDYALAHRNLAQVLTFQGDESKARTHRRIAEALRGQAEGQ